GIGTIVDNDTRPEVSIADSSLAEGDSGTSNMDFPVSLSGASGRSITVDFATADDTATAGTDYQATSGTLTFPPGTTTEHALVPIIGNTTIQPNRQFTVTLSNPMNATIVVGQATGTILDDEIHGYRTVASDGGVFDFGDFGFFGSVPGALNGRL